MTTKWQLIKLLVAILVFLIYLIGMAFYIAMAPITALALWKIYGVWVILAALSTFIEFRSAVILFRVGVTNKVNKKNPIDWYPANRQSMIVEAGLYIFIAAILAGCAVNYLAVSNNLILFIAIIVAIPFPILFYFSGSGVSADLISQVNLSSWDIATSRPIVGVSIPELKIKWTKLNLFSVTENLLWWLAFVAPFILVLIIGAVFWTKR